ncbi:phosphoribosylformylglycinamidine synthase subunit PurQ [Apilactobacillus timberlakei]|uniref:phosphoribosylformylglycinamidine synthase subunit PurQ n=1 Tax=Apilactobacillus timberlakei TaxID=2008380 RepID=UPI001126EDC3|nr:phosphoribosylformylglycinamidine synthase subunit PurQ [Apilactobacillus timberlakei]TPR20120.1 phosphoribosylformylglycinamidine synthase subunit PurQ [Apilactobacillus timberlakei]TPR21838.1 phosphoribosylformylglycinamidine synthase subunit PurQ [Apilactobacillus timberlakei]TPR23083.1 phosphoribosylformylglycinamidine synthase subunit PurQ [Apilactobacillus timberlakei]TPR24021.1 phosphoribosylformylglycinamidine synthase subunit PurQ [Apilactobacillus timberlakei]
MRFAVISFPGSNCDNDLYYAIKDGIRGNCDMVSSEDTNLNMYDVILLPGGFSFGDYLRSGAIASLSPIMKSIKGAANNGKIIIGICNGFQILTESHLLPGSLIKNNNMQFVSNWEKLSVSNNQTIFTNEYKKNEQINIPVAHGEGHYYCDQDTLASLKDNHQIVFTYNNNPNGSISDIAGIVNKEGNVLGMMPHPERAVEDILGSKDGLKFFKSILNHKVRS